MGIHETIDEAMKLHKNKIEIFQWAVMSSLASLIYSEYISSIKQKQVPTRQVLVPPIKYVREYLSMDGTNMTLLKSRFIDEIVHNSLFLKYKDAPEFVIFEEENLDSIKTIFDLYILRNVSTRIPETIAKKFGLDKDDQQIIREDSTIDLFRRLPLSEGQLKYLVDETILQLLMLLPSMKKDVLMIDNNKEIHLSVDDDHVLTLTNKNDICPIHINYAIIENDDVFPTLKFVSSTATTLGDNEYIITSGLFNQLCLTKLNGIEGA